MFLLQVLWRMWALGETLRSVCLLNTRGLGVFGGVLVKANTTGCVLWWFGEEEGEVFLGGGGVWGTVFLWAFQGWAGGERAGSKHPNPISKLEGPDCLGKLHIRGEWG